jgi:hypothetical protein
VSFCPTAPRLVFLRRFAVACAALLLLVAPAPATAQVDAPVLLRTARGGGYLTLSPSGAVDSDRDRVLSNPRSHWTFEPVRGQDYFRIRNHGTGLFLYAAGSEIAAGPYLDRADYHWRVTRLRGYLQASQRYMSSYRLTNVASNQFFAALPRRGMWAPSAPEMQYNNQNWMLFDRGGNELDVAIESDRAVAERKRETKMRRLPQAHTGCYMGTTQAGVNESWFLLLPAENGFTLEELALDRGDQRHPGRGWYSTSTYTFSYVNGRFRNAYSNETFTFHYDIDNPSRTSQLRAQMDGAVASRSGRSQMYFYKVPLSSSVPRMRGTTRWRSCGDGCQQPWTTPPATIDDATCRDLMRRR